METYWYFLLPAILCAIIPTSAIDRVTRKWIPEDKKRVKFFLTVLTLMCLFFTVCLLLVTKNLPWGIRLILSLFPLVSLIIGFFIGKYRHRS